MTRCATIPFLLMFVAGCGGSPSKVTGKVELEGKPLAMGRVTFYFGDGVVLDAEIKDDGAYELLGAHSGTAKVTIRAPKPASAAPQGGGRPSEGPVFAKPDVAKWIEVPGKYADPETSGLEYDGSSKQKDFTLTK